MKNTLDNVKIKGVVRMESSKRGFVDYTHLHVSLTLKLYYFFIALFHSNYTHLCKYIMLGFEL